MIERRATLLVDKKFEGGFALTKGTPIFVEEMSGWWAGHYYPDPSKHSSHSFNLDDGDFSLWVHANTDEPYLVLAEEDPPDLKEIERVRVIKHEQAKKTIDHLMKRLGEAQAELEATR